MRTAKSCNGVTDCSAGMAASGRSPSFDERGEWMMEFGMWRCGTREEGREEPGREGIQLD